MHVDIVHIYIVHVYKYALYYFKYDTTETNRVISAPNDFTVSDTVDSFLPQQLICPLLFSEVQMQCV